MGYGPRSTGLGAVSLGIGTVAPSYGEMVAGIFNTLYKPGSSTTREDADRLFVIGNGSFVSGDTLRSNALTILKNGNAGLGSDDPVAMLHVKGTKTNAGNVLFEGAFNATTPGTPPASGAGTRLMWYPGKAAFRAGNALTTSWDQGSTGNYSTAMGNGSIASGEASVAIGSAPGMFKPSPDGCSVALEVEDFDAAIATLKQNNVKFRLEPAQTPVCHMAMVFDPDGNTLCIHKRKQS